MSEREWLARLPQVFPASGDEIVGIGDDAAVVPVRGMDIVLCCDPVIEGVHFGPDDPPGLVGRKAVHRNLSDLAAMGAVADWLLLSLILPRGYASPRRRALVDGVRRAAQAAACTVVGGDVAVHDGPLVVTVTAVGHTAGRPLLRSAAEVGDTVHVSGPVGGAQCGDHHLRFEPALGFGQFLSRHRGVGACIDVSDGLALDLATVLAASGGLGATLDGAAIPLARAAHRAAAASGRTPLDHGLRDGEDHVLLFTVRAGERELLDDPQVPAVARRPIGTVCRNPGITLERDGRSQPVDAGGYQHVF